MNQEQYDSQLFSELYDVQPQAVVWMQPIWDEKGDTIIDFEFVYSNEEGLNYLKLTRAQFTGLRLTDSPTLDPELKKLVFAELIQVFQTGIVSKTNIYNAALNKYARVYRCKLRNGVLTVVQDRTEENRIIKRLEEKTVQLQEKTVLLQERETMLNNLLRYSPAGITITQVIRNNTGRVIDGITILSNEAAHQLLLTTEEQIKSRTITELDPNFSESPLYQRALQTLETGEPFSSQYFFAPTQKWIELSVSKMDDDHLINILLDITATKASQLEVAHAGERMQAVFNASQSGMFTLAPFYDETGALVDFTFVISNPAFAAYVNQTPEILKGRLGSDFFPGYLTNGVFDMYEETYLTGNTIQKDVHYNVDGHDLYLDLRSTKVQNEVLVTFNDYSELKKTQLRLEKLVEELKRSNANLEEFAHAASHDLKEPIRKIHVFSDRLKMSLANRLTDHETGMFTRMQNATQRMTSLVEDLLSYSHISATPAHPENVDLSKKVQQVISDLEVTIEEKKASIIIQPLPVIKGYPRQLLQLFQNLIANALKYSKQDVPPAIEITAKKVSGDDAILSLPAAVIKQCYFLVSIRDNGIGFEPQYADQIFQFFQRLHGRSEFSGTGIGLSIARKVMDHHKGYIWAEAKPGEGATFHMLFPCSD